MAGPIKIAILADAKGATAGVKTFSRDVETSVGNASDSLGRASRDTRAHSKDMSDSFDRATDGADKSETRAQGFADTLTGVQDVMSGTSQIAKGDLAGGLLTLGTGFADLAGGAAAFLIPAISSAAGAMKALNLTFLSNPVFLVIAAIVALVAIFIIAYKKSETFRRIVDGAFRGVQRAASAAWRWVKSNWPLLLAIITGPIGLAVRWVVRHMDTIKSKIKSVPTAIKGAFKGAGSWLKSAGRQIVQGLWNGITGLAGWLIGKVQDFIARTVPGPIRRALGIASPSRVARGLGRFVGQGLGLGLGDEESRVRSAAGALAAASLPIGAGGASGGSGARGQLTGTLQPGALSDSAAGALILALLRPEVARRGGLKVVFG